MQVIFFLLRYAPIYQLKGFVYGCLFVYYLAKSKNDASLCIFIKCLMSFFTFIFCSKMPKEQNLLFIFECFWVKAKVLIKQHFGVGFCYFELHLVAFKKKC